MSQCTAVTRDLTGWGHRYPCTYKVKMHHEGKGYCGVHDPVKKAAREAERLARWDAETKRQLGQAHKLRTWDGLVKALEEIQVQTHDPVIERLCAAVLPGAQR